MSCHAHRFIIGVLVVLAFGTPAGVSTSVEGQCVYCTFEADCEIQANNACECRIRSRPGIIICNEVGFCPGSCTNAPLQSESAAPVFTQALSRELERLPDLAVLGLILEGVTIDGIGSPLGEGEFRGTVARSGPGGLRAPYFSYQAWVTPREDSVEFRAHVTFASSDRWAEFEGELVEGGGLMKVEARRAGAASTSYLVGPKE